MDKNRLRALRKKIRKAKNVYLETIEEFIKENKEYIDEHDESILLKVINMSDEFFQNMYMNVLSKVEQEEYDNRKYNQEMKFQGDIIITDPCYIIKKRDESSRPKWSEFMDRESYAGLSEKELKACGFFEQYKKMEDAMDAWDREHPDDWHTCDCGENMSALGLNCLSASTEYGDWSCTTFDMDSKKPLGEFCADSGMVGVFSLEEVLKYNPDFDYHISRPWTTTLIKGFDGTVTIKKEKDEVYVEGLGNINFITKQTGF